MWVFRNSLKNTTGTYQSFSSLEVCEGYLIAIRGVKETIPFRDNLKNVDAELTKNESNVTAWDEKASILKDITQVYDRYNLDSLDTENYTYYKNELDNCTIMADDLRQRAYEQSAQELSQNEINATFKTEIDALIIKKELLDSEIAGYNQSISEDASNHTAWYKEGLAYMALAYSSNSRIWQMAMGNESLTTYRNYAEEGAKCFRAGINVAGASTPIYYWVDEGNAYYEMNDTTAALKSYDTLIAKSSISVDTNDKLYYIWGLYAKARIFSDTNPDEAIHIWRRELTGNILSQPQA
jgi:hypothetical protein